MALLEKIWQKYWIQMEIQTREINEIDKVKFYQPMERIKNSLNIPDIYRHKPTKNDG